MSPFAEDLTDTAGKFADIAIVELSTPMYGASSALFAAKLPEDYISNGQSSNGVFVGVGSINGGQSNPGDKMRWASRKVYSSDNLDRHTLIDSSDNDPRDSGGPFFTNTALGWTVRGALYGTAWEWTWRGKYTSTSFHLNRIMSTIGATQRSACGHSSAADLALFDTTLNQCKIQCVQRTRPAGRGTSRKPASSPASASVAAATNQRPDRALRSVRRSAVSRRRRPRALPDRTQTPA